MNNDDTRGRGDGDRGGDHDDDGGQGGAGGGVERVLSTQPRRTGAGAAGASANKRRHGERAIPPALRSTEIDGGGCVVYPVPLARTTARASARRDQ